MNKTFQVHVHISIKTFNRIIVLHNKFNNLSQKMKQFHTIITYLIIVIILTN